MYRFKPFSLVERLLLKMSKEHGKISSDLQIERACFRLRVVIEENLTDEENGFCQRTYQHIL